MQIVSLALWCNAPYWRQSSDASPKGERSAPQSGHEEGWTVSSCGEIWGSGFHSLFLNGFVSQPIYLIPPFRSFSFQLFSLYIYILMLIGSGLLLGLPQMLWESPGNLQRDQGVRWAKVYEITGNNWFITMLMFLSKYKDVTMNKTSSRGCLSTWQFRNRRRVSV